MDPIDKKTAEKETVAERPSGAPVQAGGGDIAGLATIPFVSCPPRNGRVLPPLSDPISITSEQYRAVKARLEFLGKSTGKPIRSLVITSPTPQDGKTFTALNLSLVLAQDRAKSVLLIDADLRKAGIREYFAPAQEAGLVEVLDRKVRLSSAVFHPEGSRLMILPSGGHASNPAELLGSRRMEECLASLSKRCDYIVIDTPPIVPFIDADQLSGLADACLLVVRSGHTPKRMVRRAMETVSKHNLIGVILTDVRETPFERYHSYYNKYYFKDKKR